jgi:hypothetical protein
MKILSWVCLPKFIPIPVLTQSQINLWTWACSILPGINAFLLVSGLGWAVFIFAFPLVWLCLGSDFHLRLRKLNHPFFQVKMGSRNWLNSYQPQVLLSSVEYSFTQQHKQKLSPRSPRNPFFPSRNLPASRFIEFILCETGSAVVSKISPSSLPDLWPICGFRFPNLTLQLQAFALRVSSSLQVPMVGMKCCRKWLSRKRDSKTVDQWHLAGQPGSLIVDIWCLHLPEAWHGLA